MTEADLNGAARGLFVTISASARLGHYEIRSPIGAGGMAEVYLAEATRLHRKVALKTLPAAVTRKRS